MVEAEALRVEAEAIRNFRFHIPGFILHRLDSSFNCLKTPLLKTFNILQYPAAVIVLRLSQ